MQWLCVTPLRLIFGLLTALILGLSIETSLIETQAHAGATMVVNGVVGVRVHRGVRGKRLRRHRKFRKRRAGLRGKTHVAKTRASARFRAKRRYYRRRAFARSRLARGITGLRRQAWRSKVLYPNRKRRAARRGRSALQGIHGRRGAFAAGWRLKRAPWAVKYSALVRTSDGKRRVRSRFRASKRRWRSRITTYSPF